MTMDLRYFNEETGQWEVMFANASDMTTVTTTMSNHISNTAVHLQHGERDMILKAFHNNIIRINNVNFDNVLSPGIYAIGTGAINTIGDYGILTVKTSGDVVSQVYNLHLGDMFYRASYLTANNRTWTPWERVFKASEFNSHIASNTHIHSQGTNGNGSWVKYDNGAMECWFTAIFTGSGVGSRSLAWTFPAAFVAGTSPSVLLTPDWATLVTHAGVDQGRGTTGCVLLIVVEHASADNIGASVYAKGWWR